MPVVSVNLSENAYEIYKEIEKMRRSKIISAALMQWNALKGLKWEVVE
jgi:hypothetical protein